MADYQITVVKSGCNYWYTAWSRKIYWFGLRGRWRPLKPEFQPNYIDAWELVKQHRSGF